MSNTMILYVLAALVLKNFPVIPTGSEGGR